MSKIKVRIRQSLKLPYYFIEGYLPEEVIKAIDDELKYYVKSAEYTTAYKTGEWDGYEHLLKRSEKTSSYFFPIGLLDRVLKVLRAYNVYYEVIDIIHPPKKLGIKLSWNAPELRDYQKKAIEEAFNAGRGVICLPTGAGKTLVALRLIYLYNCYTLVAVHKLELLYQWVEAIEKVLGVKPGLVSGDITDFREITVGMIQSLQRRTIPYNYDLLIIDEVHHIPADTFYKFTMQIPSRYRFGLTATPRREDGADLKIYAGTGEMCVKITPEYLIEHGYLAVPKFIFVDLPWRFRAASWSEEYAEGIVYNQKRNNLISMLCKKLVSQNYRVYVHVQRIDHGEILSNMSGFKFICGSDSPKLRQKYLEAFRQGEIPALISTLLGEGVDIPAMNAIILAQGMKTEVGTIQKIGRVLRPHPTKKFALILDFIDKGAYLRVHSEARYDAMQENYGKYFKPYIIPSLVVNDWLSGKKEVDIDIEYISSDPRKLL